MILNTNRPWRPSPSDRYLTVICGHLWVTSMTGEDHVVGAGQTLAIGGRGWVAQALGHGACEFTTSEIPPSPQHGAVPLLEERRRRA